MPDLAHLVALRGCLAPWIGNAAERDQHLTVLTDASLLDVQRACARSDFTHVHILAHGGERHGGPDTRYGLMLHDPADPTGPADVVSGERLASALRPVRQAGRGDASAGAAHCPAVVTLASCNSGAVGGVTGLGASIAHALHEAGIPLVIASQFPLSFGGSVRMVQTLYDGLLWGEDPRAVLVDLRRQLHTEFPDTADWASLGATRPSSGTWPRGIPTRPRGWLGVAVPATMIQLRTCRLSCFPPSLFRTGATHA